MAQIPPAADSSRDPVANPDAKVFVISVAAELSGMHPQTLRSYDRIGLVSPGRAGGGGRRYSWRDIQQLREVSRLVGMGLGLEGVRRVLELEREIEALQGRVVELQSALDAAHAALATATNLPIPVDSAGHAVVLWRSQRYQRLTGPQ